MAVRLMTPGELSLVRSAGRFAYDGRADRPEARAAAPAARPPPRLRRSRAVRRRRVLRLFSSTACCTRVHNHQQAMRTQCRQADTARRAPAGRVQAGRPTERAPAAGRGGRRRGRLRAGAGRLRQGAQLGRAAGRRQGGARGGAEGAGQPPVQARAAAGQARRGEVDQGRAAAGPRVRPRHARAGARAGGGPAALLLPAPARTSRLAALPGACLAARARCRLACPAAPACGRPGMLHACASVMREAGRGLGGGRISQPATGLADGQGHDRALARQASCWAPPAPPVLCSVRAHGSRTGTHKQPTLTP